MPSAVETAPSDATVAAPPPGDVIDLQTGGVAGKKKRKARGFVARGPTAMPKNRGSGFEEYYAEPPLSVDEYEEEMDLYHATLSFDERIETCIQRYRARRRFDNERSMLFNRYLMIGGVDCVPRQFNGATGMQDTDGLTKDDMRAMTATDVVPRAGSKVSKYYASDNDHMWTVDFAGVASGFLSVSLRSIGGSNEKLMAVGVDVVDNFLRYLQIHDVCPEYDDDIKQARAVCAKAHTELPNCLRALSLLPGQFNLACVKLFCKTPENNAFHDGLEPLDSIPSKDWDAGSIFRATVELQNKIVGQKAIDMAQHDLDSIHIVVTREVDLQITKLVPPSNELLQRYASAAEAWAGSSSDVQEQDATVQAAGIVVTKHCSIEEGYANQLRPSAAELASRGKEAFFLDAALMEMLCTGMKLRVVMHELNCDLNFVSAVKELLPSFYTFLPQELMMDWKEPRVNEREAPSVDNPDAEDEAVQTMIDEKKED